MKTKLLKPLIGSMLAFSLLLSPLPAAGLMGMGSVAAAAVPAKAISDIKVIVDGYELRLSQPPYVNNGTTLVPMKDIFNALNASVTWDGAANKVSGSKGNITLSLVIGSKEATVNGKTVKLDTPAVIQNGTTFVPLRFIAEALKAEVVWDGAARTILIGSKESKGIDYAALVYESKNLPKLANVDLVSKYDQSVVLLSTNQGQGSGVVIGKDLILTNYHVMENASVAYAVTLGGAQHEIAGVVVSDEKADLAIVKLKEKLAIAPIELGYGLASYKGDSVIAIGSPLGVQNTVSDGVISNITYEQGVRYIQTSAPIDHGSSGGALFNQAGQLIGITTLGITSSNADLNFAVSVIHAKTLFDSITDEKLKNADFLPSTFPETLTQASLEEISEVMTEHYSVAQTSNGAAEFMNWSVKRDEEGWLVFSADVDPIFYMYYGASSAGELRIWMGNMGNQLHELLPYDRIQVKVYFDREYGFKPRGLNADEVKAVGNGQWRVRYPVIDMQLKDQLYMTFRI